MKSDLRGIFKRGSRTYFHSSLFFPSKVRRDVFILYAFVRTADDFIDTLPQKSAEFYSFRDQYRKCRTGGECENPLIRAFSDLQKRKSIPDEWPDAFLRSMEMDLTKTTYSTLQEVLDYSYGAAEVIGLIMTAIMELPPESHRHAVLLGRSMQYINFLRDIAEDLTLGRTYLPRDELQQFGLKGLEFDEIHAKPDPYRSFMKKQINRFKSWRNEAQEGFNMIPRRCRIPIQTASDMYLWTAKRIEADPEVIYRKKVKPSRNRIFWSILGNSLLPCRGKNVQVSLD